MALVITIIVAFLTFIGGIGAIVALLCGVSVWAGALSAIVGTFVFIIVLIIGLLVLGFAKMDSLI